MLPRTSDTTPSMLITSTPMEQILVEKCLYVIKPAHGAFTVCQMVNPVAARILQLWWQIVVNGLRIDIAALCSIAFEIAYILLEVLAHDRKTPVK